MKKILFTILILILSNCDIISPPKKENNNAALIGAFLLSSSQGVASTCSSSSTSAIANSAITSASRTDFVVSGCTSSSISNIGFSAENITTGITGTGVTSRMLSNGDLFTSVDTQGDRSIEVTFTLNSATAFLEVVSRASGTVSSFDGSAVRITPTTILSRGRGLSTLETMGGGVTTTVGTSRTYCIDAHKETAGDHLLFWASSCAAVTNKNPPFANDKEGVVAGQGNRLGFILNGVTITNFKVGTRTAISGNFLEQ